ncbi:salivary secreted serine protease inhibitor, partial [Aphelenchoides avenae]
MMLVTFWSTATALLYICLAADVARPPPIEDPPSAKCGPHEFFDPCTGCEADCTNPGPIFCRMVCMPPGRCKCTTGYVRSPDGDCVKPEKCPGATTTS